LKILINILKSKLILYAAISISFIGVTLTLGNLLLIKGFPLELIDIEIDLIKDLPISYFLVSLLYWNIPLVLALVARTLFKG